MNNNDILRRTRYILDLKDNQITKIFKHVDVVATEQQVNLWLKREDEADFVPLNDDTLIDFLDALIIEKRGKKDDRPTVRKPQKLDNNLILMKLKIAFHLKAEEALAVMALAGFKISKHEFSALFRKKDHKHYRACKNQMLRKFMKGLQIKYRGQTNAPKKTAVKDVEASKKTGKLSLNKKPAINKSKSQPKSEPAAKPQTKKTQTEKTQTEKPLTAYNVNGPAAAEKNKQADSEKKERKSDQPKTAASVWKIPKKD